jgi:glycosyltransferase involved in cell wall biosynthesis
MKMTAAPLISGSIPFVSIIIPVLNDAEGLRRCLDSLENQTYPRSRYEVIVVDNGSKESIKDVVYRFDHATVCRELRAGSYAARNKGISLSKGSILAFIDSDCVADPNWIDNGVIRLLRHPEAGLVGGKVNFLFKDHEKPTAIELFDSFTAFQQKNYIEIAKFSGAGNLFTFKKVFEHVGLFNDTLRSGGDYEWGQRVYIHGYPLIYADDVTVSHPARSSFSQIYKKYLRVIGGENDIKRRNGYPLKGFLLDILRDLKMPFYFSLWILSERRLSLMLRIQVSSIMGIVKYFQAIERVRLRCGGRSRG